MKNIIYLILPLIAMIMTSCAEDSKTLTNLKEASTIAYNETLVYDFYAKQALNDKHHNAYKLLQALAKSADVQYDLIQKELAKRGAKKFQPEIYRQPVDSTLNNLYKAHTSIQYDYFNLFPLFIEQAQQEERESAIRLFLNISEVKKQSIQLLDSVIRHTLDNITQDSIVTTSHTISVCPQCGMIQYPKQENCPNCKQSKKQSIN